MLCRHCVPHCAPAHVGVFVRSHLLRMCVRMATFRQLCLVLLAGWAGIVRVPAACRMLASRRRSRMVCGRGAERSRSCSSGGGVGDPSMVPWIGLACRREVQCDRVTAIGAFINKTHEDDFKVAAFKRDETPAPLSRPEFHPVIAEGQVTCLGRPKICPSTSWTFGPQIRVSRDCGFGCVFCLQQVTAHASGERGRLERRSINHTLE